MAKATVRPWRNDPYQLPWRKAMFKGTPRQPRSIWFRFNEKLGTGPGECWSWRASHFKKTGYALFTIKCPDGKWRPTVAHRIAYELYIGEIPEGLDLDHLCGNRGCVNPWHLEPVTRAVNLARGMSPAAVAVRENRCAAGHEYTLENTYRKPSSPGKRECRECNRIRDRGRNRDGQRREHYQRMYQQRKARRTAASREEVVGPCGS